MNEWLKRLPTWQFALIGGLAMAAGSVTGVFIGQLFNHHLELAGLLGAAIGGGLGGALAAVAARRLEFKGARTSTTGRPGAREQGHAQPPR